MLVDKCLKCGATVLRFDDNEEKLECCLEKMHTLIPNSVDAVIEKHVPVYEVLDGKIIASVNHVMEDEHYIEWIACVYDASHDIRYLEPHMDAKVEFNYESGAKLYAYCNKHGLWMAEVE